MALHPGSHRKKKTTRRRPRQGDNIKVPTKAEFTELAKQGGAAIVHVKDKARIKRSAAEKRQKEKDRLLGDARRLSKKGRFTTAKASSIVIAKDKKRKAKAAQDEEKKAAAKRAEALKLKKTNESEIRADKRIQKRKLEDETGQRR